MIKYGKYLALLLLLGGSLGTTLFLVFNNDSSENDYVNVIPDALSVNEGELFDLAIDSNLDLSALNIVSSNLSTVRLEGSQLKALRGGTVTLTVESQDGRVQDQVLITVNPLVSEAPVEDASFEVVLGNERFTFNEPVPISQLDAPLREGYTFVGFSLEENGEVLDSDAVIDQSLTLYSVYHAIEEETSETPVVDEGDSENEDEVDEDSEAPIDEDSETPIDEEAEPSVSTPSSITVTLENDQGITMSVLTVSPGALISAGAFDGELSEVGYFLKGETCENPFDFDTPLVTDTSIVFGETNYTSPCIELDEMATLGNLQVGETIEAFVSPSAATIDYEWFISANDRDYSILRNITGSTLELVPEHFRQYIAVKLTGTGDYTGSLSLPLGRVGLSSQTVDSGDTDGSGGSSGSSCASPILISTPEELLGIVDNLSGCYALTSNIDLSNHDPFTKSAISGVFLGTLDGDGYTISGVSINKTLDSSGAGLFQNLREATIKNITLSAFNITGNAVVGGLAGFVQNSNISNINLVNSYFKTSSTFQSIGSLAGSVSNTEIEEIQITDVTVEGTYRTGGLVGNSGTDTIITNVHLNNVTVSSVDEVGGLVGNSSSSEINQSSFDGVVSGRVDKIGGIIGRSSNSKISNSSFDGTVSGKNQVGALVGYFRSNSIIENSFNTGLVIATGNDSGGIVGYMEDPENKILNSYNIGNVSSSGQNVGGLVGSILGGTSESPNEILNSYSVSNVTGSSNIGGVVGFIKNPAQVSFTAVFWNTDIGSVSNSIGSTGGTTSGSITGITQGAMQDIDTFTNASWNIGNSLSDEEIWIIGYEGANTFPWLSWQEEPNDASTLSILSLGYIPIASLEDFLAISQNDTTSNHTFAANTAYTLVTKPGLDKKYVIVQDINLSGYEDDTSLINDTFTGVFDGNGHTLSNLTINGTSGDIGLFKELGGASISNMIIDNFVIVGTSDYVGSLAGSISTTEITEIDNLEMKNISVSGTHSVGGLVGSMTGNSDRSLSVNDVSIAGAVSGSGNEVGGILGEISGTNNYTLTMVSIETNLSVSGNDLVGGILGNYQNAFIYLNSITTDGSTTGSSKVGGIFGTVNSTDSESTLINVLSKSDVTGNSQTGGIIGRLDKGTITLSSITHSGLVTGSGTNIGGIIGIQSSSSTLKGMNITALSSDTGISDSDSVNDIGTIIGNLISSADINLTAVWDGTSNFDDYVGSGEDAEKDPNSDYYMIVQP